VALRRITTLFLAAFVAASALAPASSAAVAPPQTGFEKTDGAAWTTHEEELEFLAEVDAMSERLSVSVIGKTKEGRPLHLVKLGNPAPHARATAHGQPTILYVCSQHGNEPAGREACLKLLRDLAFTDDPELLQQLGGNTILFVPSANPDGRAANTRENSSGVDINRDHLNLTTPESRAIAKVVRDWRPEVSIDLHEYGPSIPAFYDDEVLYLWPRNLNADQLVRDMAKHLAHDFIEKDAEDSGYTADEYGQYAAGDQDVHQSAGDGDEGIMRNTMGLRHSLGILVETAVTQDPRNGPDEASDEAAVNRRRVDSHMVVSHAALRFLREEGQAALFTTDRAFMRKLKEGRKRSAPVYFDGADNQEPTTVQDPPPCAYSLTAKQRKQVAKTMRLLGIAGRRSGKRYMVHMGQPAEPLIPLLLDERGLRHSVAAKPQSKC